MLEINKGVGQPVELVGIKGTYLLLIIAIVVGGLLLALLLYWLRANTYLISFASLGVMGVGLWYCLHMSKKYGLHGIAKQEADRSQPKAILINSTKSFAQLRRETQRSIPRKGSATAGRRG
ncbi:DUF4133 domain-containing protein [Larkinella insperata]|uniref:DUF4133 domain-containing protein n=1 Tax=Larkinella insperata TaxID=332158 RepID=A0ABW3QEJ0_9BACT